MAAEGQLASKTGLRVVGLQVDRIRGAGGHDARWNRLQHRLRPGFS
jgi:hypothetical protein